MYENSRIKPNDKLNWLCKIRNILFKYGFNDVWIKPCVINEKLFIPEFKQTVVDNFISEALSYFETSPKCSLYQYIHDGHNLQFYLSRSINCRYKPLLCRYRINAHSLNIETGRYFNIARNQRFCNMCNMRIIEDEFHFILECKKYEDIRHKYIKPYYFRNPSAFKLVQLLSVRNIKTLNNLGKYLYVAEKLRNNNN